MNAARQLQWIPRLSPFWQRSALTSGGPQPRFVITRVGLADHPKLKVFEARGQVKIVHRITVEVNDI